MYLFLYHFIAGKSIPNKTRAWRADWLVAQTEAQVRGPLQH